MQCNWASEFGPLGMNDVVWALTVFDDGTGPALYAGGDFTAAGGVPAVRIAKWNGTQWEPLGSGINERVNTLTVFDDGTGPALYAGGDFTAAGGVPVDCIAKWNGTQWFALGTGGMNYEIQALTVFDDGTGPALYAGGWFTTAGGVPASRIAKWNGTQWSALGSGMGGPPLVDFLVSALTVFDDGTGPALYAGGRFGVAGGVPAHSIAKWNGIQWSALGSGMHHTVLALTVFDDGTGPALYAGGHFLTAGGVGAFRIAKWNGTQWSELGSGMGGDISDPLPYHSTYVSALTVFDDGTGPALYAGGRFLTAGGVEATRIATWNGTQWFAFGSGMNHWVRALAVFDDGTGPALYAGGVFTTAGGVGANSIAKWNGMQWSALGSGMGGPFVNYLVLALTVFDDGTGPALYAGGVFTTAGGVPANRIAKWNGTQWFALGSGMNHWVRALAVFDDGTGPALYAGGVFTTAGGVGANSIAKWDGMQWSALGSGMGGGTFPYVLALTVFDDGTGPALYVGGVFTTAGGAGATRIAKWNGTQWFALGTGMNNTVSALTVFDDGTGPALYAGGDFTAASGVGASRIATWNGTQWAPLGTGMNNTVLALMVFDDGTGPALYAGGDFTAASGKTSHRIGAWRCTMP